MPIPVVSQNPPIFWDYDVTFPILKGTDSCPETMTGSFDAEHWSTGLSVQSVSSWNRLPGATGSSGGATAAVEGGQQPYLELDGSAASPSDFRFGIESFGAWPDTGTASAPLAGGAEIPALCRGWWLSWLMRSPTATPGLKNGVVVTPENTRNARIWPSEPVGGNNHGGFGFTGDGAGQWQYASYDRSGVGLLREAVALPAHLVSDWNLFELFVTNARPGLPATVEAYFNGNLVVSRGWAGGLLEDYAADEFRYIPHLGCGDLAITQFRWIRCRKGGFSRQGAPL